MKYKFTGETREYDGRIVRQIRKIKGGRVGGWIEHEKNLSQLGDCWVHDDAVVMNAAVVRDNALVYTQTIVKDNAVIRDRAIVGGASLIAGGAIVGGHAHILGHCRIVDSSRVMGFAFLNGNVHVEGFASIGDFAYVTGHVLIAGSAEISGYAQIDAIERDPHLYGVIVQQSTELSGHSYVRAGRYKTTGDVIYLAQSPARITLTAFGIGINRRVENMPDAFEWLPRNGDDYDIDNGARGGEREPYTRRLLEYAIPLAKATWPGGRGDAAPDQSTATREYRRRIELLTQTGCHDATEIPPH